MTIQQTPAQERYKQHRPWAPYEPRTRLTEALKSLYKEPTPVHADTVLAHLMHVLKERMPAKASPTPMAMVVNLPEGAADPTRVVVTVNPNANNPGEEPWRFEVWAPAEGAKHRLVVMQATAVVGEDGIHRWKLVKF